MVLKVLCVDIQGFNISNVFIPKELSFYDGERLSTYLFKPPFPRKFLKSEELKTVVYLEDQYHGLLWESGYVDLNDIPKILDTIIASYIFDNIKILVKGDMKTNFLREFNVFNSCIVNIPNKDNLKLSTFMNKTECYNHDSDSSVWHCSQNNVKVLYNFRYCYLNDVEINI